MNTPNFPPNFLETLKHEPGFDAVSFINAHESRETPTSIRLNTFKPPAIKTNRQVPWCNEGFYLDSRPSFTFDPLFHAGCYYVQEASSMFIGHILNQIKPDGPVKILDLCAAPGGKSTLLNSAMQPDDLLVANEIIKMRVPVLADNLTRWGTANTIVTNNDPKDFNRLKGFFDIILVDAPCSGSGMFRKDPNAMGEWSEANVAMCHQRQERILADIYPCLKEGGYLIYSTCSYSHQENEDILDWLCDEFAFESRQINSNTGWGITETQSPKQNAWGYRFYPGKVKGEGLFAACLQKTGIQEGMPNFKNKEQQKVPAKEIELVKTYIVEPDRFYYFKVNDEWMAIHREHLESLNILQRNLYLRKSGVRIGKLAGKDLVPGHELAQSIIINKDAVMQTELDREQAIQYLRRDNLILNTTKTGWSLMNFVHDGSRREGQSLGWAKLLPNRVNNYYPKELRILSKAEV